MCLDKPEDYLAKVLKNVKDSSSEESVTVRLMKTTFKFLIDEIQQSFGEEFSELSQSGQITKIGFVFDRIKEIEELLKKRNEQIEARSDSEKLKPAGKIQNFFNLGLKNGQEM